MTATKLTTSGVTATVTRGLRHGVGTAVRRSVLPMLTAAVVLGSAGVAAAQNFIPKSIPDFIPDKPEDILPGLPKPEFPKKPEDVIPGLPKPRNPFLPRGNDETVISDPTPPAPVQQVWIQNRTNNPVYYQLYSTVTAAENFSLSPGAGRWHTVRAHNPRFGVTFDNSFAAGFQTRRYTLTPGSFNDFIVVGNGLDLFRR